MGTVVASVGSGTLSAYAKGLRNAGAYLYAKDFRAVALKAGSPLVRAYLLGHSLELYLKAYLHTRGIGEGPLKTRIRHNLVALLELSEKHDLGAHLRISPELRRDLVALNVAYSGKSLEYFSWTHLLVPPRVPDTRRLSRFASNLDKLLRRLVADAV